MAEARGAPARSAGAYVMLRDGEPLLVGAGGGLRLAELNDEQPPGAGELVPPPAGLIEKLAIERLDGEPVIGSGMEAAMIEAGFRRQPRRLVA
jgi:ATP-dependent Lhr-like helicase